MGLGIGIDVGECCLDVEKVWCGPGRDGAAHYLAVCSGDGTGSDDFYCRVDVKSLWGLSI